MITKVFLSVFGLGAILDILLAMLGMAIIFQASGFLSYAICAAFSFAFFGLRLCTERICISKEWLYRCLSGVLFAFIFMNLFATANALAAHLLVKQPLGTTTPISWSALWESKSIPVLLVSSTAVFYFVSAPVFLSYLLREYFHATSDDSAANSEPDLVRETIHQSIPSAAARGVSK